MNVVRKSRRGSDRRGLLALPCTVLFATAVFGSHCSGTGESSNESRAAGWPVAQFVERLALSQSPQGGGYIVRGRGTAAPFDATCDVVPHDDRTLVASNEMSQRVIRLELFVDEVLSGPQSLAGETLSVGVHLLPGSETKTEQALVGAAILERWGESAIYMVEERDCGSGRRLPVFQCDGLVIDELLNVEATSANNWFDEEDVRDTLEWLSRNPLPASCDGLLQAYSDATGEPLPAGCTECQGMDWELPDCLDEPRQIPPSTDASP